MSRILLVYASHHGQTFDIARRIAQRLRAADHEVVLADARAGERTVPPPNTFDLVVLGSNVRFGRHAAELESYIRAHRVQLARVQTAFFSVSMSAAQWNGGADPNDYLAKTFAKLGWRPDARVAFGGALQYSKYSWLLKLVMRQIARRGGHETETSRDYAYTDDAAVDDFAVSVAARLERAPVVVRA